MKGSLSCFFFGKDTPFFLNFFAELLNQSERFFRALVRGRSVALCNFDELAPTTTLAKIFLLGVSPPGVHRVSENLALSTFSQRYPSVLFFGWESKVLPPQRERREGEETLYPTYRPPREPHLSINSCAKLDRKGTRPTAEFPRFF